jgi:hypothetical protein
MKIKQISATVTPSGRYEVLGLGDDNNVYSWHASTADWHLYKMETSTYKPQPRNEVEEFTKNFRSYHGRNPTGRELAALM